MRQGRLFCFGFGYCASALAGRLAPQGWTAAGTGRETERIATLAAEGIAAHPFARDRPLGRRAFEGATHILVSIPPDAAGDPVLDAHAADLAALSGLAWIGYLSTTGVYGDRGGAWVDETAALRPREPRSRRRAAAEAAWLALASARGLPVHVFRLAGIYGPGRSALDAVRAGRAHRVDKPGHVFSRIHVDDIASVLAASIARPRPGAIYNVADDLPAPGADVIAFACELLGARPPPLAALDQAGLSPLARSFYAECRRVRNDRIKDELGVRLAYPDYKAGLAALLAAGA